MAIIFTQSKEITYVQITTEFIESIFAIFQEESTNAGNRREKAQTTLGIEFLDINGEENSIEIEGDKLPNQFQGMINGKVTNVKFNFRIFGGNEKISLDLYEKNSIYFQSRIKVESSNRSWIDIVFNKIIRIIEGNKVDAPIFLKYKKCFFILYSIVFGFIILNLIATFYKYANLNIVPSSINDRSFFDFLIEYSVYTRIFAIYLLSFAFGMFPALLFENCFLRAWPKIEFIFAGNNNKTINRMREARLGLLSIIIIPILINLLS